MPPVNDDFANAIDITGLTSPVNADTTGATAETPDPLVDNHGNGPGTVWYKITLSVAKLIRLWTDNSTNTLNDTVIGIYSGSSLGTLTEIAYNDDAFGVETVAYYSEIIDQFLSAGTYYIALAGYGSGNNGTVDLHWTLATPPTPPANDDVANAELLVGTSGSVPGTNIAATNESPDPIVDDHARDKTVWYQVVAPFTGGLRVYLTNPSVGSPPDWAWAAIYENSPVSANEIAFGEVLDPPDPAPLLALVTSGNTYWIEVANRATGYLSGDFILHWSFETPPANDDFANAINLTGLSGTESGDTSFATEEVSEVLAVPGLPDYNHTIWYKITPATNKLLSLNLTHPGGGCLLGIFTGTDIASMNLEFPDGSTATDSISDFPVTGGTEYHIGVEGNKYNGDGSITLVWSLSTIPGPPSNDSCATARSVSLGNSPDFDNRFWAGTWDTSDPLFAVLGYGGGVPLWFKFTNTYGLDLDVRIQLEPSIGSPNLPGSNSALYSGSCGSLTMTQHAGNSNVFGHSYTRFTVADGETIYIEVDAYDGDTSNPPTAPYGSRGKFKLVLDATYTTYKDGVDGTAADGLDYLDVHTAQTNYLANTCDFVKLGSESWELYGDGHDNAYGPFDNYIMRFRYFDGSTFTTTDVPLQSGDSFVTPWSASSDFDNRQPTPPIMAQGIIETDGTDVWVAIYVLRTLTNPYSGGTMAVNCVAVYHWNGSSLDFIDYLNAKMQNRMPADGQIAGDPENDRYTGHTGFLVATASPTMSGKVFIAWGEEGQKGKIGASGDTSTYYWGNRICIASFSTSAKLAENDAFTDDTQSWSASTDLPLPGVSDYTPRWLDDWHSNRATAEGTSVNYTTGFFDAFVNWMQAPLDGFATAAYGRCLYHLVNDDGVLQFFLVPPIPGDQTNGTQPQPRIECYEVNATTLVPTLMQWIDHSVSADFNPGSTSILADFRIEPHVHHDPISGRDVRYITVAWDNGSNYPQVIAIPSDLSHAAYPFDNNPSLSLIPFPIADNLLWLSPDRHMVKQSYTDRFNQLWTTVAGAIIWFDRKCSGTWLVVPPRRPDGVLWSAGHANQEWGSYASIKWNYDTDDIRGAGLTMDTDTTHFHPTSMLRTHLHVGRDSFVCATGVVFTPPTIAPLSLSGIRFRAYAVAMEA